MLLKLVSHYDLIVLSNSKSVSKTTFLWALDEWGELYPVFFLILFKLCKAPKTYSSAGKQYKCQAVRLVGQQHCSDLSSSYPHQVIIYTVAGCMQRLRAHTHPDWRKNESPN